jgi:predicted DNA-binding protein
MARTKPPSDKELKIRLPQTELKHLEAYCVKKGKTKTEVVREFIRNLKLDSQEKTDNDCASND